MKPYGLRPGDGVKCSRVTGLNKFSRLNEEGGPRGKNAAAKIGKQRRLVHRQARQDEKRLVRAEMEEQK
jgi:hypothetical protein